MRLQPFRAATLAATVACAGLVAAGGPATAAAAARVTHAPHIRLSSRTEPPTSTVRVSGSGFGAYRAVDIYFDTKDEALAATDGAGAFSGIRIHVPAKAVPGAHYITAVQRYSGRSAQARFMVNTNWPQVGYSASHSGLNPYENVLSPSNVSNLSLDWWRPTSEPWVGFFSSAPAVVNGVVYLGYGNGNGTVHALNAATGAEIWSHNIGQIVGSSPAVANGVVYVGTFGGPSCCLYALNAATGRTRWSYSSAFGSFPFSAAVAKGVVYAVTSGGDVVALNAATGTQKWSNNTASDFAFTSPAVANGVVYLVIDRYLRALNASNGSTEWTFATGDASSGISPAVVNGVVYVGSESGMYALNAATGAEEWSDPGFFVSAPAVANGVVYINTLNGTMDALNAATGAEEWSYPTGYTSSASPAVANGVVYIGSSTGVVYALNAATGAEEWSYTTGEGGFSSPAVADGVLYLSATHMYAFGLPGGVSAVSRPVARQLQPNYALRPQGGTNS